MLPFELPSPSRRATDVQIQPSKSVFFSGTVSRMKGKTWPEVELPIRESSLKISHMRLIYWFKDIFRSARKFPRMQARPETKCFIELIKTPEVHEAWICDLSQTGIGILTRANGCEIGTQILTHFDQFDSRVFSVQGRLVGQDIVYYGPLKKIENSFFRYSICFDSPLPENELKRLQKL